ncbi:MAG: diaminopimelate epimerase [Bacteroidetes bacterium]|nr:diaminopimelate epimerase [Bacteroidota bacterium]MBU1115489.1 diaminopimelate epimerase [Bacteroidota bacterium]MBU1798166.1 diaminopimelate epimerase [Bacteroidota bacterium]
MNEIVFTKITGAGNDFILIDKKLNNNLSLNPVLIKSICDRRYGIGGDGILTISDREDYDFEMDYFNSDGSNGMLCGNGARSIIRYADYSGRLINSKTKFIFHNEPFSGEVLNSNEIKFNLNTPTKLKLNYEIEILNNKLNVSFIDTGAYHVVINIDEKGNDISSIDSFPVEQFGKEIRYSKYYQPLGTNVNFISIRNEEINIRTFERGVEAETLACGTGSVASAMISYLNGKVVPPVRLVTKSKEVLTVDFKYQNEKFSNIALTGPAKIVFEGKYKI